MIPLFKVHMPAGIEQVLGPVLESGYISQGPKAQEFEEKFQRWVGNPNVALVNSGTSAITLALKLAGVGPGTEVITSPMTCLATNEPILTLGGTPVWCDIDPATGNIDPTKIEALITGKTKAIIFVDWAGTPAELDGINCIAHQHGLLTIEDAAHSLGALYRGQKVGTSCDYTTFSFQAIKHLTTVDGGALACRREEDYRHAVLLRWFGMARRNSADSPVAWVGDVTEPGYKMHMNDVNAAIGLEQLRTVDERIVRHKDNGRLLCALMQSFPNVRPLCIPDHIDSSYWIFTVLCAGPVHRERVSQLLTANGVGHNIVHVRNDSYSLFAPYRRPLPGLDDFSQRMLSVPCGWWCSEEDMGRIAGVLAQA